MPMQVILLERVDNLGNLGDVVSVKPGYARNYLIPQSKALRATKDNVAYFEARKKDIEKQNEEKKKEAAKQAKALEGLTVTLIRLASEDGSLYGSVSARDIADVITAAGKQEITRGMVVMNQTYKQLGLFPAVIMLHPEVKVTVTINIARSQEEAKLQEKSGKALIASEERDEPAQGADSDEMKKSLMEEDALKAEQEEAEEEARREAEDAAKSAKKSEARAAKKAEKATGEEAEEETATEIGSEPAQKEA